MLCPSLSVLNVLLHLGVLKQLHNGVNGLLKLMKLLHHLPPTVNHLCECVCVCVCVWGGGGGGGGGGGMHGWVGALCIHVRSD